MAQKARKDRAKSNAAALNNLHIGSPRRRPKYDAATQTLKSAGEDLAAPGLTEYMWDVVWVTWAASILVALLGNWAWFLWAVVPAYGAFKAYGMMGAAKQMAQMGATGGNAPPAGNRKQRRQAA
ncbi:hypothetical protein N0V88_001640 [Collariella sp. IMI 366227]|nr:hypothetical protein N0V88_001640 [Collariella sp. IMI 366227]